MSAGVACDRPGRGHVRQTVDPCWVLVPEEEWPSPMPAYVDRIADLHDDLVAGRAVNVEA